ncbi:Pentatricopeptide repeat-containing protein [Nymphaea thermarum]|nr:Pentatricopeptide repeat-containing protein [Nymphaea thermarum]
MRARALRGLLDPVMRCLHQNPHPLKPPVLVCLTLDSALFSTERRTRPPTEPPKDNDLFHKFRLTEDEDDEEGQAAAVGAHKTASPVDATREGVESRVEVPPNAKEIFNKMKETGMIPNAVAMLDGLCKDGLIQVAMKLFGLMRENGTIPDVVIYTAVVDGFCKAMQFDDATKIFKKMQSNGVVPNAYSYGVIIQGLCRGQKLDDALSYCLEMLEHGHHPNVATFMMLVDGFCKQNRMEEVERVIGRLREKGFALNEKDIREHLDKKGPFHKGIRGVIFGKRVV